MAKKKKSYFAAVIEDDLQQLAESVLEFRTVRDNMIDSGIDRNAVEIFDKCYQEMFNSFLANLYNCLEMELHQDVKKGLNGLMYFDYAPRKKRVDNGTSEKESSKKGAPKGGVPEEKKP